MAAVALLLGLAAAGRAGSANFPYPPPNGTESGQIGYNQCGSVDSQGALCQTAWVNSNSDFCVWGPPEPNSEVGDTEEVQVAWCMQGGHGARIIPAGTFTSIHTTITSDFIQMTGTGDFTKLNIRKGDAGGELDPHGATGQGNPIGGLVYSTAFGNGIQQIKEWTNYMSDNEFCFRACNPEGPNAALYCQHIYDVMGCEWVMPSVYQPGNFETCEAESGNPPGIYGNPWTSTFYQGQPHTPAAHPAPSSSKCVQGTASAALLAASGTASASIMTSAASSTVSTGSSRSSPRSSRSSSMSVSYSVLRSSTATSTSVVKPSATTSSPSIFTASASTAPFNSPAAPLRPTLALMATLMALFARHFW